MEISRNKANEIIFSIIYSCVSLKDANQTVDFKEIVELHTEETFENSDLHIKLVSLQAIKNQNEIEEMITPFLKNWKFSRLSEVTKCIIYFAYASYKYVGDIDKAAVINISVDLSKKYDGEKEYKFINALLDAAL
ncbi:MAG: transcription antitermination factor NusB [Bacilli bacterium]